MQAGLQRSRHAQDGGAADAILLQLNQRLGRLLQPKELRVRVNRNRARNRHELLAIGAPMVCDESSLMPSTAYVFRSILDRGMGR